MWIIFTLAAAGLVILVAAGLYAYKHSDGVGISTGKGGSSARRRRAGSEMLLDSDDDDDGPVIPPELAKQLIEASEEDFPYCTNVGLAVRHPLYYGNPKTFTSARERGTPW